jgi:hypothetical protein
MDNAAQFAKESTARFEQQVKVVEKLFCANRSGVVITDELSDEDETNNENTDESSLSD